MYYVVGRFLRPQSLSIATVQGQRPVLPSVQRISSPRRRNQAQSLPNPRVHLSQYPAHAPSVSPPGWPQASSRVSSYVIPCESPPRGLPQRSTCCPRPTCLTSRGASSRAYRCQSAYHCRSTCRCQSAYCRRGKVASRRGKVASRHCCCGRQDVREVGVAGAWPSGLQWHPPHAA